MNKVNTVILCGGMGTRLYPYTSDKKSKQELQIGNPPKSMLEMTLELFNDSNHTYIVTSKDQNEFTYKIANERGKDNVTLAVEPKLCNTAMAIACSAVLAENDEKPILIAPIDFIMADKDLFYESIDKGLDALVQHKIVFFGVKPTYDETEFSHLVVGDDGITLKDFASQYCPPFSHKKPAKGDTYWHSGLTLARPKDIIELYEQVCPDILECARLACSKAPTTKPRWVVNLSPQGYDKVWQDSFEHMLQNSFKGAVVELNGGWGDMGNWRSIWFLSEKDKNGNAKADLEAIEIEDCKNCYFDTTEYSGNNIACSGLENVAVIATRQGILIADMNNPKAAGRVSEKARANIRRLGESR